MSSLSWKPGPWLSLVIMAAIPPPLPWHPSGTGPSSAQVGRPGPDLSLCGTGLLFVLRQTVLYLEERDRVRIMTFTPKAGPCGEGRDLLEDHSLKGNQRTQWSLAG